MGSASFPYVALVKMVFCPECNKELKNERALRAHTWRAHTDSGKKHGQITGLKNKGRPSPYKGLTKETSPIVAKMAKGVQKTLKQQVLDGTYVPRQMGDKARTRLSVEQSLNNRGGRAKWFDLNGQKLQGTWEYNIARKLNELGIKWYKPKLHKDVWKYVLDGKEKSYTPDLFLEEYNIFLEIKGYWWGNDRAKMDAVIINNPTKTIIIIEKEQYDKIMQGELVWS